jgi:hypothetical protein
MTVVWRYVAFLVWRNAQQTGRDPAVRIADQKVGYIRDRAFKAEIRQGSKMR